jgi:hypothetical protein
LIAGALCALLIIAGERGMLGERHFPAEMTAMSALGILAAIAALAIA